MTTTVSNTIGSSGNYTSLQSWEDACPANLITADQVWQGLVQNQAFSSATTLLTISGQTTDANHYVELTTASGASFSSQPGPLRFNSANGASLRVTGSTACAVIVNTNFTRISKLQFDSANATTSAWPTFYFQGATDCLMDGCIVAGNNQNTGLPGVLNSNAQRNVIRNTIVAQKGNGAGGFIAALTNGPLLYNVTLIAIGTTPPSAGILTKYISATLHNCYVGGCVAPEDGVVATTKTNCATDATAAGYTTVPFSAATFMSVATDGTHDLRLAVGSALINAGAVSSNAPTDIMGTVRPQGAAYDIGAWEYVPPADTVPPTMTGTVNSSGVTSTGFTMDWSSTTRSDNIAITGYETSPDGGTTWVDRGNVTLVAFTGLNPSTSYTRLVRAYDANGNRSTPALSLTVVTSAPPGDQTLPVLAGSITQGTITSTSSQISWPAGTDNVAVTSYEVSKDGGTTWLNVGNVLSYTFTGLTAATSYSQKVRAKDAAGNVSTPALSLSVTTSSVVVAGTFKTLPLANNTGTLYASGTTVTWEWHQARVGTAGSITYGSGTVAGDGTLTAGGLPTGSGYLLAAIQGTSLALDKPYYQSGTAA